MYFVVYDSNDDNPNEKYEKEDADDEALMVSLIQRGKGKSFKARGNK